MDHSGPGWLAAKTRKPDGTWGKLVTGWALARVCGFELCFYSSDANGAHSREIWNANRVVEGWPRFSPHSKRIRVTVDGQTENDSQRIFEMNVDGGNVHPLPLDWPADADQRDGQWTPDGRHFLFTSSRGGFGLSSTYELVSPPWFAFWKKASTVRLTPEQMDVVAVTPTRDSTRLIVIGRVAQGSMMAYDPKEQRFIPILRGLPPLVL